MVDLGPVRLAADRLLRQQLAERQRSPDQLEPLFWILLVLLVVPWTLAGPLFLTGKADEWWWQSRNDCRVPSEAECARLEPLWNDVCARADLHPDAYRLRMTDQSTINAFASGDSVVSLDQGMLDMSDGAIAAVIAHELGHHTKRHIGGIVLAWWYGRPAQFLLSLLMWLIAGILAIGRSCSGCIGMIILISFFAILVIPAAALYAVLGISTLLLRVLGRKTEFEADANAIDLGLGHEMVEALRHLQGGDGEVNEKQSFLDRLTATHPPLSERISRAETELAGASVA